MLPGKKSRKRMEEEINQLKLELLACQEKLDHANQKSDHLEKQLKNRSTTVVTGVQTSEESVPNPIEQEEKKHDNAIFVDVQSNLETEVTLSTTHQMSVVNSHKGGKQEAGTANDINQEMEDDAHAEVGKC